MQKFDIKNIVSEGEGQTVEFKSTFDKETIETLNPALICPVCEKTVQHGLIFHNS